MSSAIRKCAPYAACVVVHLACSLLFSYESAHEGLISPSGAPHFGVLVLGIIALVSRVLVLFVLPVIGTYQLLGRMRELRPLLSVAAGLGRNGRGRRRD